MTAERGYPTCGARKRQGEGTCARPAGWGTDHPGRDRCKLHGGSTPGQRTAARRQAAREAAETYGLPVDVDPGQALLDEVCRTAGHVAWLRDRVGALDPQALVWGEVERVERGSGSAPGTDVTHRAELAVWVELYLRERRHLVDVCRAALAARVEDRQVELAQAQGELLAAVVRAILADLDLTAEQQARAPEVVRGRLRAVARP